MYEIIEKIGRAGGPKNREQKRLEWNKRFGKDKWTIVYYFENKIYTRDEALEYFYNESYYNYLKNNIDTAKKLCSMAYSIYNPHAEATGGVDLQCPAVEKALEKLGLKLNGKERIAIGVWGSRNGKYYPPISHELSPFKIPIWCNRQISVESFWQDYKYLAKIK